MAPRYGCETIPSGTTFDLDPAVRRHVLRVMRMRAGDEFVLFDPNGAEALVRIESLGAGGATVRVLERTRRRRPTTHALELAFSPPRPGRLEQVFEHGTELGVTAFHLLVCARTPPAARSEGIKERWGRVVQGAAGQSGAAGLPSIHTPRPLEDFARLVVPGFAGTAYIAAPDGMPRSTTTPSPALIAIGPEGGFTPDEYRTLVRAGCQPLSLGPYILRIETAALAAAALFAADR